MVGDMPKLWDLCQQFKLTGILITNQFTKNKNNNNKNKTHLRYIRYDTYIKTYLKKGS